MQLLDVGQQRADRALAVGAMHRRRQQPRAGRERRHDVVEHGLEDRRHAGHDVDVADLEARSDRDRVVDVRRAARHARHALARVRVFDAARRVARLQHGIGFCVVLAGHAEGAGNGIGGDVVVGRTDAAGGEDVGVARAQRIDRGDDLVLLVGDDAHLLQVDADRRHDVGEVADVAVLGAARQDLVADHDHRRRHYVRHRLRPRPTILVT